MRLSAHIISTLFVSYNLFWLSFAAREWDTTSLSAANSQRWAIEVVVVIPVIWTIDTATLKPVFLNPVDEILLIRILSIMSNKCSQTICCLLFYLKMPRKKKQVKQTYFIFPKSVSKVYLTHPLSRSTNTIIPAKISKNKIIIKNIEYYNIEWNKQRNGRESFLVTSCRCDG